MISSSRLAVLALVGLAFVGSQADAQFSATARPTIVPFPINPNQQIAPNVTFRQAAYNTAVLGRGLSQIPPYLYGYNPYPSSIISSGPGIASPISPLVSANPYALATSPIGNPYLSGSAALSSSPYSLSTAGGSGYTPSYSPYGYAQDPYSASIQGLASLTSATGKYYVDVQRARILREQSRQAALDTTRKRIELEAWYETVRPTAPKMLAREQANALDQARMGGSDARIWSGQDLNTLLKNIQKQGTSQLKNGSNVPLEEDTLKSVNLTSGATTGNVGMLKDGVKLTWPQALDDQKTTAEARKRLARDLRSAVDLIKDGETVEGTDVWRTINSDFKTIKDKLSDSADELSMSQYIEAKRYLNQLEAAIKLLSDKNAKKYFNTWTAKGKNVAELVSHMTKEGLKFAPATPGDEASYNALYTALRSFDSSLNAQK